MSFRLLDGRAGMRQALSHFGKFTAKLAYLFLGFQMVLDDTLWCPEVTVMLFSMSQMIALDNFT
jgi:hypothetical protein